MKLLQAVLGAFVFCASTFALQSRADLIEFGQSLNPVYLGQDASDQSEIWAFPAAFARNGRASSQDDEVSVGYQGLTVSVMGNSHLGGTASMGWVIGRGNVLNDIISRRQGFLAEVEVGQRSVQFSVGRIRENFVVVFPVGTDLKLTYLMTQGQATWGEMNLARNYLGAEADLYLFFMKMGLGIFRSVDWDREGVKNWLGTFSAGIGF